MARKKWRTVYPGSTETDTFPSQTKAYDFVDALRSQWAAGGTTGALTVQVDEGSGWEPYEHINFAKEG